MTIFWVSIFLVCLPNAFSQRVEQTPRAATKQTGETLTINCVYIHGSYGLHGTSWFRQSPGKTQWERLSIGGRFVESVNKGAKSFSLQIRNLIIEDTATYYCKAQALPSVELDPVPPRYHYIDGDGTKLIVNPVRQPTRPNINLLYSATDEQIAKDIVELICLISEYQPENIGVIWRKNGQAVQAGFITTTPAKSSDGTFTSTSVLKVPVKEWANGSVYTCQVSHSATSSNLHKDIQTKSELAIFLREPLTDEIWINKTATLVCEVISTIPSEVPISWTVGGKERVDGVHIEQATKAGNQYLTVGRLTSSVTEWFSGVEYVCSAQENQSTPPVSKRTGMKKVKPMVPKLHLLPPPSKEIQSANTATLTCLIRGFAPDDITISWLKDGANFHSNVTNFPTALEQAKTFSTKSLLFLTAAEWKKGATYSCVATHSSSQSTVKGDIAISKEDCPAIDITATAKDPSFEEIWTLQRATIVCEIVYTDLQNVTVSWLVNGSRRVEGVEIHGPEWRGSQSTIVSKLKVNVEEWESGVEFLCFVENSELPTPVKASTKKSKVTEMQRPKVYLLHPSSDEIQAENAATLICLVTGFYPTDIYVAWMVNDTLLDSGYSIQTDTDKDNGSISVASKLRVAAEDWEKGTTFSCLVGHPSLTANLVRSINISHGKPTLVNVSLVLTDSFKSCI